MKIQEKTKRIHTVVIGGGQAGLAVGYHLAQRDLRFVILDAHDRIGDAWRNRWDSLRLFTPARYAGMPGLPFQGRGDVPPTKEQMADYLEGYAKRFSLPVRTGVRVQRVARRGERFVVTTDSDMFDAENVVVAMANYQTPHVPEFAPELRPSIVQLHSHEYRNPGQLREGTVLVVGAGNSGADIAMEVARTHSTILSGKESGHIPFPIDSWFARFFMVRLVRFVGHHVLTLSTPIGRKLRPKMLSKAAPLVRVKPKDLIAAGIERVPKVSGVRDGLPVLADGRALDVANIIWCTGYRPGFSWIDVPVFDDHGRPLHERGVVAKAPGLYFLGLHYLYSMTSATVIGVGRDAERVARAITSRGRLAQAA